MKDQDVKELEPDAQDAPVSDEQLEQDLWNELEDQDAAKDASSDDEEVFEGERDDPDDNPDGGDADSLDPDRDDTDGGDAKGKDDADYGAEIEKLKHQLASEKGRSAANRREIEALNSQIITAQKRAEINKPDDAVLREREAKLNEAAKEYGDVIGPLLDEVKSMKHRQDDLTAAEQRRLVQDEARLNSLLDEQDVVLREYHPDGLSVVSENAEVFRQWIDDQPKQIRDIFVENQSAVVDGRGVALLLSEFKLGLQTAQAAAPNEPPANQRGPQGRRERQLTGARSTSGRSTRIVTSEPATGGSEADHWDYFERIDRKKQR